MYYSRGKRKMVYRTVLFTVGILLTFVVVLNQRGVALPLCTPPISLLTSFCKTAQRDGWNLFYHLGGIGPWIPYYPERQHPYSILPLNCKVDQMHLLSRHAERYPTQSTGRRHLALLEKLHTSPVALSGSLAFVHDWKYFVDISSPMFEELTRSGPYAGIEQARRTGKTLRQRYGELVDDNKTTNFWTSSSSRNMETAKWFGKGFFGEEWETGDLAQLQVIPEDADRGGDTLTPGDTCLRYGNDTKYGHEQGLTKLAEWQNIFTRPIAERLTKDAGGIVLTSFEIYSMMEMCGFEIIARGSSPWCSVFTEHEWREYEYGRDLLHFYKAGPGNDYAGVMGLLWLNATTSLLNTDTARGVYMSFVHDGDIMPVLATLGVLNEQSSEQYLPSGRLKKSRKWRTSNVVPMGGRLILERSTCNNTGLAHNLRRSYVRLYINDGIIDLESSIMGGGLPRSVGLTYWNEFVRQKRKVFGDFRKVCGLATDAPDKITFLTPQYH